MTAYVAPLRELRDGRFAVEAWLQGTEAVLLLVTATSPRTTLLPALVERLGLPQIRTPTPIRGRARPLFLLDQGVRLGNYHLTEAVVAAHTAAGLFGVQGVLGTEWLAGFDRVCLNRRTLELEMYTDP